jgi:hypothetical protein
MCAQGPFYKNVYKTLQLMWKYAERKRNVLFFCITFTRNIFRPGNI